MVLARMWGVIGGPISLLLVARCLSAKEQGFYYTIGSLLSMQLLFELGLMQIITQVTAHEMSEVDLVDGNHLRGDRRRIARIGSLLRHAIKWFACAGGLMVLLCVPLGLAWLGYRPEAAAISWRLPWILAVSLTAANLITIPLVALLNGLGLVSEVAKATVFRAIGSNLASWSVLIMGGSLLAVPALLFVGIACGPVVLLWRHRHVIRLLWREGKGEATFNWKRDVWPLQWRAAASWISGWFVFQLFTPIIFRFNGAEAAGRIGMALNIATQYSAVVRSWFETKSPVWGRLIAQGNQARVFQIFKKTLFLSTAIFAAGASVACLIVTFVLPDYWPHLSHRLLSPLWFAVMFAAFGIIHVINGFAICVRAFKVEPFFKMSTANGILAVVSMFTLGRWFGTGGLLTAFIGIQAFVILPWTYTIFKRFKSRQVHRPPPDSLDYGVPEAVASKQGG